MREIEKMKLTNNSNIIVYGHDRDEFENPSTLTFLSKLKNVKFIDFSSSLCEGKTMTGNNPFHFFDQIYHYRKDDLLFLHEVVTQHR